MSTESLPNQEVKNEQSFVKLEEELSLIRKTLQEAQHPAYWTKFFQSVVTGFGTVVGATVVFAIFVFVLTQLGHVDFLRDIVNRILDIVQSRN